MNILEVLPHEQLAPPQVLAYFSNDPLIHFPCSDGLLIEHVQKAANLSNLILTTVFEKQGVWLKIKIVYEVLSMLDILSVEYIVLKLVIEGIRKFHHDVAGLREYEDIARRFQRAEEEEVHQNFIQKGHIVHKVDLKAEDALLAWVEFQVSESLP